MTPPARRFESALLSVTFDSSMDAWTFTGSEPGPAGTLSVLLDEDVRFSVDAADPTRIVEIAVGAQPRRHVTPAALELTRALLGDAAADIVAAAEPSPGVAVRIPVHEQSAVLSSAAALAVAVSATSRHALAHRLRGLDVALHANRVGSPALVAYATNAAWAVWPGAVALARACGTYPTMLTRAPMPSIGELRSRLLVLLHLVEQDDPSVVQSTAFRIVTELVERTAAERIDIPANVDVNATIEAMELEVMEFEDYPSLDVEIKQRVYKGSRVSPRPMRWRGSVEDFASRLGAALQLLHSGPITASGQAPGELTVAVPVALGVRTADLRDIRVRAVTDLGVLLDEGSLAVQHDPNRLPVGILRLVLPDTAEGRRYESVVIDVAHHVIAIPNTADLARLDRLRAIRAGQEAVACAAAGDHRASARLWRECADKLNALHELELHDRALEHADEAKAQAEATSSDRVPPEWLTTLLAEWSRWALNEVDRLAAAAKQGSGEGPIEEVRELVDRLAGWNDPSIELARAHQELGMALREAPQYAAEPNEADSEVREAMRIFYDLGDNERALGCLRELRVNPAQG